MVDYIDFVEGIGLVVDSLDYKGFGNSLSQDFADSYSDSYCWAVSIGNYTGVNYFYLTWVVEEPVSNSSKNSENCYQLYYNLLVNYSADIVYLD